MENQAPTISDVSNAILKTHLRYHMEDEEGHPQLVEIPFNSYCRSWSGANREQLKNVADCLQNIAGGEMLTPQEKICLAQGPKLLGQRIHDLQEIIVQEKESAALKSPSDALDAQLDRLLEESSAKSSEKSSEKSLYMHMRDELIRVQGKMMALNKLLGIKQDRDDKKER